MQIYPSRIPALIFLGSLFSICFSQKPADKKMEAAVNRLNDHATEISYQNTDSAIYFSTQALSISKENGYTMGIAHSEDCLGNFSYIQSNYSAALEHYFSALRILENHGKNETDTLALKSILILRSTLTGNIGNVYSDQGELDKALEYYTHALELDRKLNNQRGIARHLGNIGLTYWLKKNYSLALDYNLRSLKIFEEQKDENGATITLANIGSVFHSSSNYNKALYYYSRALEIDKRLNRKFGIAANLGNMGSLYLKMKKFTKAEECLSRAISLCDSIQALDYLKDFERTFLELDSTRGDYKGALAHFKKYIAARDSIINEANIKKQTQLEMQFEFDKKQTADSVMVAEEKKVAAAELRTEKNKSYSLYGGLALVIIFAGFIFNRFKVTQRQKLIIEEQKLLVEEQKKMVEEKQKEILDSINYAKRIQMAQIPGDRGILKMLHRVKKE